MMQLGKSTARNYSRDRGPIDRELQDMGERLRRMPAALPEQDATQPQTIRVVVDVGNGDIIGNDLEGIVYAPSVTPADVYDPNVDTVYPAGLGCGFLYINGELQSGKVLIRHNYAHYPVPLLTGTVLSSPGTTTLTYDPGTGPVSMTAYLVDFV